MRLCQASDLVIYTYAYFEQVTMGKYKKIFRCHCDTMTRFSINQHILEATLWYGSLGLIYQKNSHKINQSPYNRSLNLPFHNTRQTEAAIRCSYNLITFDVWTYAFSKFQISNWMCLISNELLWPDCKCQMHCCQICPDLNKDFSQKYFLMFLNWNDVTSLNSYLTSSTWFNVVLIFIFSTESLLTK